MSFSEGLPRAVAQAVRNINYPTAPHNTPPHNIDTAHTQALNRRQNQTTQHQDLPLLFPFLQLPGRECSYGDGRGSECWFGLHSPVASWVLWVRMGHCVRFWFVSFGFGYHWGGGGLIDATAAPSSSGTGPGQNCTGITSWYLFLHQVCMKALRPPTQYKLTSAPIPQP